MSEKRSSFTVYIPLICILSIIFLYTGCDDTICSDLNSSRVYVSFFDQQTKNAVQVSFDSITAAGTDSVFYRGDSLAVYELPVNTRADSTLFLFYNPGTTDSLLIRYNREMRLLSEDCGISQLIDGLDVPFTTFSDVKIKNKILSIANESNIEIYY